MLARVEAYFPSLVSAGYVPTSEANSAYNCFSFVVGDELRWTSPLPGYYWPVGVPRENSIGAFAQIYAQYGFEECNSISLQAGVTKIAVLVNPDDDTPDHASLQLRSGRWLSKMWSEEDMVHTLEALQGPPLNLHVGLILQCHTNQLPRVIQDLLNRYS